MRNFKKLILFSVLASIMGITNLFCEKPTVFNWQSEIIVDNGNAGNGQGVQGSPIFESEFVCATKNTSVQGIV